MSPAEISQIEAGNRKSPGFESIVKIAAALELSLDAVAEAAGFTADTSAQLSGRIRKIAPDEIKSIRAEAAEASERVDKLLSRLENI